MTSLRLIVVVVAAIALHVYSWLLFDHCFVGGKEISVLSLSFGPKMVMSVGDRGGEAPFDSRGSTSANSKLAKYKAMI